MPYALQKRRVQSLVSSRDTTATQSDPRQSVRPDFVHLGIVHRSL